MNKEVYIIVVNYNGWQDSIACLESILRLEDSIAKTILIDNCSTNDSLNQIELWARGKVPFTLAKTDFFPGTISKPLDFERITEAEHTDFNSSLTIISADQNGGFASANNIALKKLIEKDALVWLLNPDMVSKPDALNKMIYCWDKLNDKSFVLGSTVKSYAEPERVLFYGGSRVRPFSGTAGAIKAQKDIPKLNYISGSSFFTHLSNFKKIGYLPEQYFLYWEETHWCYQAKKQGLKFEVCVDAICYDKEGTSTGRSDMAHYFYARNAIIFMRNFLPHFLPFVLCYHIIRIVRYFLIGRFGKSIAFFNGLMDFATQGKGRFS